MEYPIERNGYIYNKRTKEGFIRMKRQGIPKPLFSLQDKLAKLLNARYRALIRQLLKDLKSKLKENDITLDKAPEEESIEELLSFFEEQGKKLQEENKKVTDRIFLQNIADGLKKEWHVGEEHLKKVDELYGIGDAFEERMRSIFRKEREDYLERLLKDAPDRLKAMVGSFSIDKNLFFEQNLDAVQELYLKNSMQRIAGEEYWLKRRILKAINDYATGQSETLKIDELARLGFDGSSTLSSLFARDQMQRFNKACTLSTFKNAGVTKVKWVTCGDGRVRNKNYVDKHGQLHRAHTELNGKIFDVNNLPIEIDDYNCRCGLVPVEYSE